MALQRTLLIFASLAGAGGILIAAASAHAPGLGEASRAIVERASFYQLIHAGMLFAIAQHYRSSLRIAAALFILGTVFFCGGIYAHHLAGITSFTRIVPMGGISFSLGWLALLLGWRFR